MPVINIDYDNQVVTDEEIRALSLAIQKIVAEATAIDDVNVYTNTAHIKVNVLPIEIFIRMSAGKVENGEALVEKIKARLSEWKAAQRYPHLINIYLIPMHWQVASDI